MAVKTFTNEQLTASDTNTYLANAGLVYVAETTFSGSAVVQFNNVFTSTFRNYRIIVSNSSGSTATAITAQFTVSGTASGGYQWAHQGIYTTGAGANASSTSASYADFGLYVGIGSADLTCSAIDVLAPQLASRTYCLTQTQGWATNFYVRNGFVVLDNTTQYDGIKFYPYAGGGATITGTISIYGYRKA